MLDKKAIANEAKPKNARSPAGIRADLLPMAMPAAMPEAAPHKKPNKPRRSIASISSSFQNAKAGGVHRPREVGGCTDGAVDIVYIRCMQMNFKP